MRNLYHARWCGSFARVFAPALFVNALAGASLAYAGSAYFSPGNLVLSRTVYDNNPNNVTVGETLPPNCAVPASCVLASNDGTYPFVFNNAIATPDCSAASCMGDASFGVTAKIFLDQLTPAGSLVNSLEVPNSTQNGVPPTKDQLVTSFNSKSELALNLSTDHQYLTFLGYVVPVDTLDASNSNTPGWSTRLIRSGKISTAPLHNST
jgi:hypothetical protein